MTDAAPIRPELKRGLGLGLLTLYGVGVMVGAGIYVLVGEVAGRAGMFAPLSFLLSGVAAAFTAASFAELSARIPESAGEAAYALKAFDSRRLALLVGLGVAGIGMLSAGAVLQGGVGYLRSLVDAPGWLLIAILGAALTGAAVLGVVESLVLAALLTLIEVGGLLVIVTVGLGAEPGAHVAGPATDWSALSLGGVAGGVFLAFFAFIGFEDMVNMAEETRRPERTVPLAILLAVVVVAALYLSVSWAAVRIVPPEALAQSRRPLALVYETATGRPAGFISAIAVAAALNGVLAQVVMSARVAFGLGRRVSWLGWLHRAHPRFHTPALATLIAGAIVMVLAMALPLAALASATSLVLIVIFIIMNLSLIRLKAQGPPPPGAPNLPLWTPWLGVILSAAVLISALWSVG